MEEHARWPTSSISQLREIFQPPNSVSLYVHVYIFGPYLSLNLFERGATPNSTSGIGPEFGTDVHSRPLLMAGPLLPWFPRFMYYCY